MELDAIINNARSCSTIFVTRGNVKRAVVDEAKMKRLIKEGAMSIWDKFHFRSPVKKKKEKIVQAIKTDKELGLAREIPITVGRIRRLAKDWPDANVMLRRTFPEAFEDEWREITAHVKFGVATAAGMEGIYVRLFDAERRINIGYVDTYGVRLTQPEKYKADVEEHRCPVTQTKYTLMRFYRKMY
jgi:hypothetical protein